MDATVKFKNTKVTNIRNRAKKITEGTYFKFSGKVFM